jgi:hypothetical protein
MYPYQVRYGIFMSNEQEPAAALRAPAGFFIAFFLGIGGISHCSSRHMGSILEPVTG